MSTVGNLKKKARNQYLAYQAEIDRFPADCGRHMAEHFRPRAALLRDAFNNTMQELAVLDPSNCPIDRL